MVHTFLRAARPSTGRRATGGGLLKLTWSAPAAASLIVTTRNGTQQWSREDVQCLMAFLEAFLAQEQGAPKEEPG